MIALTAFLHWWLVSLRNSPKATLCLAIKMALTFLHGRFIYISCTMIELGVMKASWHAKSIHYETMKFYIRNLWWEKCPPYFTDRTVVFLHNGTLANHCPTQHSKSWSTLNLRQTKLSHFLSPNVSPGDIHPHFFMEPGAPEVNDQTVTKYKELHNW